MTATPIPGQPQSSEVTDAEAKLAFQPLFTIELEGLQRAYVEIR